VMTDDMLPEYSYITTVHDVPTPEGVLSAGAVGSIVMVYPEHRAYLVEFEAPWHVLSLGHDTVVPNDELNAELAATHERLSHPPSREQIVANELCAYIDLATPVEQWTNDDWLDFARHMIKTAEVARDTSAEEATASMNAPWPKDWPLLPKFDEL
jgi:Domain of unknown function (DUF4926)